MIGAVLSLLTGIGWYAGQVEPDCFTPLVILGCYLLLFRGDRLGKCAAALGDGHDRLWRWPAIPRIWDLLGGLADRRRCCCKLARALACRVCRGPTCSAA